MIDLENVITELDEEHGNIKTTDPNQRAFTQPNDENRLGLSNISESSVIKSKHKRDIKGVKPSQLRLDGIENINCSESIKSVLNFNPDDVIAKKGFTFRTKKSFATSNIIVKTPHGLEIVNKIRPLQYLQNKNGKLKLNKRQQSENPQLRFSEEMMKIMHRHHLSSGNYDFPILNQSKMKRLENAKDEEEIPKEISNYIGAGDIESIFGIENRHSLNIAKDNNSIQLSTLSTNPQKRERSKKNQNEQNPAMKKQEMLNFDYKQALIEDNSVLYDENIQVEGESAVLGPNEAMYFNGDPIPFSHMLSFEEAIQRQKEILDKSSKVNQGSMPVWDSLKHTKNKFYKKEIVGPEETKKLFESLELDFDYELKRIGDITEEPGILEKKLEKIKIKQGKLPPSISITGAILS